MYLDSKPMQEGENISLPRINQSRNNPKKDYCFDSITHRVNTTLQEYHKDYSISIPKILIKQRRATERLNDSYDTV